MTSWLKFRKKSDYPLGQGLLEATVAIGIILIGLGGVMALTFQNLAASNDSVQQIVAMNLAREGIEAVRAIRDSNWLADNNGDPGRVWDFNLQSASSNQAILIFDPAVIPASFALFFLSSPPDSINDNTHPELNLLRSVQDSDRYVWTQNENGSLAGYVSTGYRRLLILAPICKSDASGEIIIEEGQADCNDGYAKIGIKVISQVSWLSPRANEGRKILTVAEAIYNWR